VPFLEADIDERLLRVIMGRTMNRISAFAISLLLGSAGCESAPSDKALLGRFEANKTSYERLRDLLAGDAALAEVGPDGVRTPDSTIVVPPPTTSVSKQQYQQYMDLLRSAGATRASRSRGANPEICVGVWSSGWAGDVRHKNICWRDSPPAAGGRFIYKSIESNWYLVEER